TPQLLPAELPGLQLHVLWLLPHVLGTVCVREAQTENQEQRHRIYSLKVTVHAAQAPTAESGSRRRRAEKTCGNARRKRTKHS
ncbi:Hypothetical predicted protein, partial [Marmota monax]